MATANYVLTPAWSLLVAAGDEFLLTLPDDPQAVIEVATLDAVPEAPKTPATELAAVVGHRLGTYGWSNGIERVPRWRDLLTRTQIGPGVVYGRTVRDSLVVALSAWTPAS